MKSKVPIKPLLYVSVTAAFFIALILLDDVFGFHYEPIEHNLANETTEQLANIESPEDSLSQFDSFELQAEEEIKDKSGLSSSEKESESSDVPPNDQKSTKSTIMPSDYFSNLIADYKKNTLSELDENKARTDIVIRYYHHEPDGNSAYALSSLGFYIHEREVAKEYANYQSNAIFFGDSISLADLQIVSYTLLQEGLPIKIIKPSKFHDSWKAHSIEIGTDTTAFDKPTITYKEIQSLTL